MYREKIRNSETEESLVKIYVLLYRVHVLISFTRRGMRITRNEDKVINNSKKRIDVILATFCIKVSSVI
jgi:hypothetical protein